uniref:Uncharacterized protein n=1 Tax=Fagus sylvatica TaxID=28930 RepID=A0A2N9HBC4_FAGSY
MTPGSRGAGAVFVYFSGEDSGQTGEATGEPRVARRSWSRHLSNAPGLAGQLAASRKDSAREVLGIVGKLALPSSARFQICGKPSYGWRDMVPRTEVAGVFLVHRRAFFRKTLRASVVMSGEVFSTALFHRPVFVRVVQALHRGKLGFARYDLANRGRWNVLYAKGLFSDRDSGLTRGALDDPEVARCS